MSIGNRGGGRPRKSQTAKELAGTVRWDRSIKPIPPGAPLDVLKPPRDLNREAKREWRELAPRVAALGLLTVTTEQSFRLLCATLGTCAEMEAVLARDGMVSENAKGARAIRPETRILQIARAQSRALLESWGLSPRSRENISIAPRGQVPPLPSYGSPVLAHDNSKPEMTLREFLAEGAEQHAENMKKYSEFHSKDSPKKK
jgi:P27 family predicted phage terminase small subunit